MPKSRRWFMTDGDCAYHGREVTSMDRKKWVGFLPFYLLTVIVILGLADWGSRAVTTISQTSPVPRQHRFVIDAGHGGIDGGATSCTGVLESTVNLQIALRMNDLMHLLGYETVMVRTTDTSVYTGGSTIAAQKVSDLKERVRIVRETPDAVLISIHQNTFSDSRYGGAQVFYGGAEDSKALAERLQSAFVATVNPGSSRKCKKADGVYLMQNITCTGVLIECGFLSNPGEEAKLRDPGYQKMLCCVIASSVSCFVNSRNGS